MRFAGIIAEYDPFHNGHAWQLAKARRLGAEHIAVAMSCGLVQRGTLPLLPEAVRAQAALLCGADLIFALPAPCACTGAEAFARAGVSLLAAVGCDGLVFGAETPDARLLMNTARLLLSEKYSLALKVRLSSGARSFAAARQAAVAALDPAAGALLDQPNNNLAVEYCKAILELNTGMEIYPLPRMGAGHGQALALDNSSFASASALRALWAKGGSGALAPYVPSDVLPLYQTAWDDGMDTDFSTAGHCQLSLLRAACREENPFTTVRGISEGLDHRLEAAVRSSAGYEELVDRMTTVRFPRARMRRLAMDAALGYTNNACPALPPYLHLLGARRSALPLLKQAALPASHSLARLREESADCARMAAAQLSASDFGALCHRSPAPMGELLRQKTVFLTE